MSATNLDLPVLIAPEQIRRREFVTIRRGYDPDQVRDYMEQLADQVELMHSMLREARSQAQAAVRAVEQPRVDPYEQLAQRVSGVIREADAAAEKIRSGARQEAERVTYEARSDADRIRTDAQARAEQAKADADATVRQARAEADRTLAGLAARRTALVEQLTGMQERLLAVAHDLERTIEIDGSEEPPDPAADDGPQAGSAADDAETATGTIGPTDLPAAPTRATEPIVDVRDASDKQASGGGDDRFEELDDPAYEELWEGTQSMRLEMPEIPPLDLDWGDEEDGDPLEG